MEKFEPNLLISVTTASYLIISMYQITTYYTVPEKAYTTMCQMKANTTLSQMKYEPDEVGPGSSGFRTTRLF